MLYLFHSVQFMMFFAVVFSVYWLMPQRHRNKLLLAASYIFYASWDWRFLSLVLISTLVDYICGLQIHKTDDKRVRKLYLGLSITINLSLLCFFKYFNFFLDNLYVILHWLGLTINPISLQIILPLGISFYTFQTMSYSLDIYRKKIEPTRNFCDFALFVSYFPQMIAGPIERAKNLLPQIQRDKTFSIVHYKEGAYLFIYGLFKKIVIADTLGRMVTQLYALQDPSGIQVLLAIYAFALQIYCDFSGYSNMARGISAMFDIQLSVNFNLPFFSKDYLEFYKRWHMTLCAWIYDYVYIPLYFYLIKTRLIRLCRTTTMQVYLSATITLFVVRLIFGVWHGATWNFVWVGVLLFAVQFCTGFFRLLPISKHMPEKGIGGFVLSVMQRLFVFHTFALIMVFFRAENTQKVSQLAHALFSNLDLSHFIQAEYWYFYILAGFLCLYEMIQYKYNDQLIICKKNFYLQIAFYSFLFFLYVQIGAIGDERFIYFQF